MSKIIAIDLGSSNSVVSVWDGKEAVVISNNEGKNTTPSIVGFQENGEIKVGAPAKRQAVTNPKNTVYNIKRFIGRTWDDSKQWKDEFPYELVNNNGYPNVLINGKKYTPQEISAMILQKLKHQAEEYLGEEVKDAVITVPAYFNDSQRVATKEAAQIAGLNVRRIVSEPTAAAMSFGLNNVKKDINVVVVDAGGSTYDISFINITKGDDGSVFEVLNTAGDLTLGGHDIDQCIIKWLVSEFKDENGGFDLSSDQMAMQRLKEAAEKAKIELSSTTSSEINLPYITAIDGAPKHLVKMLTRAKFEQICHDVIQRHLGPCEKAFKESGLSKDEIDEVILVGGTTRIPAIQELIKNFFGKEPNKSQNADLAISQGACVQAAILNKEEGVGDIVLLDVTPLALGLETMGGVMTKLIEANTTIPCKKTEVFSTAADNQTEVTIHVLQGDRPMASQNKSIGQFNLTGIAPAKRGVPKIEVSFDIDANGILKVSAKDQATGKEQSIRIEASSSLSEEEINRMRAEAEANAEADKKERKRVEKLNQADSMIFQTENQLNEFGDKVPGNDKAHIESCLEKLKDAHKASDVNAIDNAIKELNEAWNEASQKMYSQNGGASGPQMNEQQQQTASASADEPDIQDADFEEVK